MKPERIQAILQAFRREHPGCLPVHVGGQGRPYHVIAQTSHGLELFTGQNTKGKPLDVGLPQRPRTGFGIPHASLAAVKVAHARRLTPPPDPGPLLPHLLALHGPDLDRQGVYNRLADRLRALIPDPEAQLSWEGLWRHLHARAAVTTNSLWHDGQTIIQIAHRDAFTVTYEYRGHTYDTGVVAFLERFTPAAAAPPAPRATPKPWNPKWTNAT